MNADLSISTLASLSSSAFQDLKIQPKIHSHRELIESGDSLLNQVKAQVSASDQIENLDLKVVLTHLMTFTQNIRSYINVVNNLEKPGSRDPNLSSDLLHYAIAAWGNSPIDENARIIRAIYSNGMSDGTLGSVSSLAPEYLLASLPLFSVKESGKDFPGPDQYCRISEQQKSAYAKLDTTRNEIQGRLDKLLKNPKAEEQYRDVLPGVRGELKSTEKEIYDLALAISDIDFSQVNIGIGNTEIKVSLHESILSQLIQASRSFEKLITEVVNYKDGKSSASLEIPLFDGNKINLIKFELGEYLKTIKSNPELLATILDTYEELRSTVRFALSTGKYANGVKDALMSLEQSFKEKGSTSNLLGIGSSELNLSIARHYSSVIIANSKPGFVLEDIDNQQILSWAIKSYLYSNQGSAEFETFESLLSSSPNISEKIGAICKRAHKLLRDKDFENLAKLINHDIITSENNDDNLIRITTLTLLQTLCDHPEASRNLRHQIPDLEKLTLISEKLNCSHPSIGIIASSMVGKAFKTLQSSLANFHTDREQLHELWECIDTYRFFLDNRQIVQGISGNEIMKSGLLLVGPPGAGKTHLANSLRTELGLEMYEVSPTKKELGSNQTMLDVARKQIDTAKKLGKPCIIFIDEAEAIAMERSNPNITQQQHDLTDYILQEIDEIRRKHPHIFLIAATNYGDKIDEAMTRNGRFDYAIYMDNPTIEVRKNIIKATISEHKLPIILTDEQINELATMAEKFMPLALKRPLIELARVKLPMGRAKDLSFETVKECFQDEVNRLTIREARQQRKKEAHTATREEALIH